MDLMSAYDSSLEKIFTRAALLSSSKKKLFLSFLTLFASHLLGVVFFAIAEKGSFWAKMELSLLPYFVFLSFLYPLSILLIRIHHHEARKKELSLAHLYESCKELLPLVFYLSLLPLAVYLIIWLLSSFVFLLQQVPFVGIFFTLFCSWIVFFLWLVALSFLFVKAFFLFLSAPLIALQKAGWKRSIALIFSWIQEMPLRLFFYFGIGIFPFLLAFFLLRKAFFLTEIGFFSEGAFVIQYLFYSILSSAFLSPFLNFFSSFSAEAVQLFLRTEEGK